MKKILALIFAVVLTASCVMNVAAAENRNEKQIVVHYDDGSYSIIMLEILETRSTNSRLATKTHRHYSANNELEWTAVLRGLFHYDGVTSSCTSSVCDVTIYNNEWSVASKTARTSGNSAVANLVMNRISSGIVLETRTVNLTLSCDPNGNLS